MIYDNTTKNNYAVIEEAGRAEKILDCDAAFTFIFMCIEMLSVAFGFFLTFFPSSETC